MLLFLGARYDFIFGFNRMDSGFDILLVLFVFVPLLNLFWVIIEIVRSCKRFMYQSRIVSFLMPLIAFLLLAEAIAVDLYIASYARM